MHTVFALLYFVVVIHWLIFPYPSGLLHWHCGNLTIAPVPAKQPWWIWINTSCEFIMNDCITTTKQSTTKPCVYFLGYTVLSHCLFDCNNITHYQIHHIRSRYAIWHPFSWCWLLWYYTLQFAWYRFRIWWNVHDLTKQIYEILMPLSCTSSVFIQMQGSSHSWKLL